MYAVAPKKTPEYQLKFLCRQIRFISKRSGNKESMMDEKTGHAEGRNEVDALSRGEGIMAVSTKSDDWTLGFDIRGKKVPRWLIALILVVPTIAVLEFVAGLVLLALNAGVPPDKIVKLFEVIAQALR